MKIKQAGRNLLSNNLYLNNLYYKTMFISQERMRRQIEYCQGIDSIADVTALRAFRSQFNEDNPFRPARSQEYSLFRMYGYWNGIFGKLDDKQTIHYPTIEHGLNFVNEINPEVDRLGRPSVVTFGTYRKEIIHKYREWMPVFCIGPYLHYADYYYSEAEIQKLKQKLGKALLVFPAHTTPRVSASRNEESYYKQISTIASNYDSVLVNVYWWNLNDDIVRKLESDGYKIVSAGFQYDINFANRLKTIIRLADLAIGDSIGTHIGFCADENVPFCYIPADTKNTELDNDVKSLQYVEDLTARIIKVFENAKALGEEQKDPLNYYWGLDCVRTPDEIQKIYEINKDLTERGHGSVSGYKKVMARLLDDYYYSDYKKYELLTEALR